MSQQEVQLLTEKQALMEILDFHARNKEKIWDNEKDYELHINDILDRINAINEELSQIKN
jgi:hypothetical protein